MDIGLSIGLGRFVALEVSDTLILGDAVEVKFHRRRRGIIVPMPDRTPLSRRQFQEIVELIAKEGQIALEVITTADEYAAGAEGLITRLQELDMIEVYPQLEQDDKPA